MITYQLEQLDTNDARSNEFALKLTIKNDGDKKCTVMNLVPNIPSEVELSRKADAFEEATKQRFMQLSNELSDIAHQVYLMQSEDYRREVVTTITQGLTNAIQELSQPLYYMAVLTRAMANFRNELQKRLGSVQYEISSKNDAVSAYERLFNGDAPQALKNVYEYKMSQLAELTEIDQIEPDVITTIEPASFYSRTYVLKFQRRALNTKLYYVEFDSKYKLEGSEAIQRTNVSTTLNISPKPFNLTLFAAVMSVMGTILKSSLDHEKEFERSGIPWLNWATGLQIHIIPAVIIALVFINIYEFTDMGKKLKMNVNWRTALLIGVSCGLFGDKLVDALKALLGVSGS